MLQYSVLYCNRLQEAKLYRNTKLYCDSGLGARGALKRGVGRAGGALGAQAAGAGARTAGSGARGVSSKGADDRQRRAGRAQQGRGRRAAWPGMCTRCTRLDFQTDFSTRYFS